MVLIENLKLKSSKSTQRKSKQNLPARNPRPVPSQTTQCRLNWFARKAGPKALTGFIQILSTAVKTAAWLMPINMAALVKNKL